MVRFVVILLALSLHVSEQVLAQAPSITTHPSNTTSSEGQNATLVCAVNGNPTPTVQWYKDGLLLNTSANPRLTQDHGSNSLIITALDLMRSDEGLYVCNATNNVSSVISNQAYLTVNYPSKILVPPTSQTVVETSNVSLTCYLEGKPVSNVTWLKDGTPVIPANDNRISVSPPTSVSNTSATIIIANVNRNDEGSYSCQAVNDVGNDTSSAALLTVNYGIAIFVNPRDQTKNEGESVTITCEVEGKPAPTVTWLKNGNPLTIDTSRMNVTQPTTHQRTVVSLTINDLKRTDEGGYICNVQNSNVEQNSSAAQLTVTYPSKILVPPTSQTVVETSSVSLKCYLEGKPVSNVTWFKDGIPVMPANDNRISVTAPTSVSNTSATITITNMNRTDEGSYSCQAVNDVGNDTSSAALLTVNYVVTVFVHARDQTKNEVESVTMTCEVEGKPAPTVTWLKNGNPLTTDTSRMNVTQPTTHQRTLVSLTINDLKRTDEGGYSCNVKNGYGEQNSTAALLTVNYPSKILVPPTSQTVVETSSVSLTCYLEGKPVSNITWFKDGTPVIPANDNRISVSPPTSVSNTSATITITNVNRTDKGSYSCQAVNDVGNDTSSTALLTVNYGVTIFVHPRDQTKNEGESVIITCEVEGKPAPTVTWLKNGNPLTMDTSRMNVTQPTTHQRTVVSLTINDPKRTDEGGYSCNVKNGYDEQNSTAAQLTVNLIDLSIVNPRANFTSTASQSTTLVCEVWGDSPNITWHREGKSIKPTHVRVITSKKTAAELTLNNVQAEHSGTYTCTASNYFRTISTQMNFVVIVPFKVDMDVTVENMEFSPELNNKSSERFQNLSSTFKKEITSIYKDIEGFKEVQVLGFKNGSVQVVFRVIFEIRVNKPVEKPPPDVKQKVANAAIKEIAKTNGFIGTLKFKPDSLTPLVPPPPPRNLTKKEVKLKQISIAWEKPEYHQTYGVTGYKVQYKEFGKKWNDVPVHGKDVNDYVINDLKEDTKYLMRIVAINMHGEGPPSNRLEVSTDKQDLWTKIWADYKWVIVGVGIVLFLLILTGICLCCRRKRRPKEKVKRNVRRNQGNFSVSGQSFSNNGFEMAQLASKFREIPRDQIMIGKELGSGQFGLVNRGYLKQDRMHCAIKMLKESAPHSHYRDLLNELDIMSSVEEHPNIINLIGACTQGGPVYLVVELAEYGSLLDFLHNNQMYSISHQDKVSILTQSQKIRIGRDVARGLEHLARYRCVHRDLAARNVLLGTNMTAKLSDFGLARDIYERGYYQQLSNMKKLPIRWMSVEAIETMVATKESDIWSFGVLLWEIYTGGKLPFSGLSAKEILKTLKKGTRLGQPIDCSDQMYSIMMSCWHSNPLKRPTIDLLATVLDRQLELTRNDESILDSSTA